MVSAFAWHAKERGFDPQLGKIIICIFFISCYYLQSFSRELNCNNCLLDNTHCLDRTPDCTFLGTGSLLPRWRTGKPARGRYIFYNHFISILIVIQYQRPDLRTLYAFLQSSLVSLSQKSHRFGYGGIISSPLVYILIF